MRIECSTSTRTALLRRVAGLIYVPDRERGEARQRVLRRLGLDQAT